MSAAADLSRLSLNQITIDQCSLPEAIDALRARGADGDRALAPQGRRGRRRAGRRG